MVIDMKRHVDICSPNQNRVENKVDDFDWKHCFICQEGGTLQNPKNNPTSSGGSVLEIYNKLAANILRLASLNELPTNLDLEKLKSGDDLGQSLFDNCAVYHKNCKKKFSEDKVHRAEKRHSFENSIDSQPARKLSRRSKSDGKVSLCFFCEEGESKEGSKPLHKVTTFKLDARVRQAAIDTKNSKLYAKLQNGDMCAQDALYHSECICKLYRDANRVNFGTETSVENRKLHGIAFSKVLSFIDENLYLSDSKIPVFKLADLIKLYSRSLEDLGLKDEYIHSTRFKERIKRQYEDMIEDSSGRDVILAFKGDIADIISNATHTDFDNEALVLAEASKIIRRDILHMENTVFDGKFHQECQEESISESLKYFLNSVMNGNHTKNPHYHQAALTVGQIMRFNTLIRVRASSMSMYHSKDREPPLAIYLSELIHSKTRNLEIVDKFAHLGLCISKDRLYQISTALANSAIDTFERDGVVVPLSLDSGLFCTTALDNIDHNPTSSTSYDSFHGTAASVNQHLVKDPGVKRTPVPMKYDSQKLKKLPETYNEITPFYLPDTICPPLPKTNSNGESINLSNDDLLADQKWLNDPTPSSWAAFHSQGEDSGHKTKEDRSALLPIWQDDSKSPATIKHVLEVLEKAVHHLNPGQPIVTTLDQPLYAIAKKIQWKLEAFGITNFVFILGSLHTEMAMLSTLGDWLTESGWLELLSSAKITGTGNQALLTGKQVSKTKYCHQVTAYVLNRLMKSAFDADVRSGEAVNEDFVEWRKRMEVAYPQFRYWSILLQMEMDFLLFVRSIRSRNFSLYKYSIDGFLRWMFLMGRYHYARWLSVHALDMNSLEESNAYVFTEFDVNGNFVVARTRNKFSSMGIDQRHEQLNADVKGAGGAIGLTDDEDKFLRWMLCAPEESRLVSEFESFSVLNRTETDVYRHHEDSKSFQSRFRRDISNLEAEFEKHGNPFKSRDPDLVHIISNDVMDSNAVEALQSAEKLGIAGKTSFMEMLQKDPSSFNEPIKLNNVRIFDKARSKTKQPALKEMKDQLQLFSQLYVATQVRDGDLDEFFMHETLSHPPSLSKNGLMRSGNKSELIPFFKELVHDQEVAADFPIVDGVILEGSVIVNQLKPNNGASFSEYAEQTFFPYVKRYKQKCHGKRVDICYDTYLEKSLKGAARGKRGKGIRRKVTESSIAPNDWRAFLRGDENKSELFRFLAQKLFQLSNGEVMSAYDNIITALPDASIHLLCPTDHEEADTRVFLHANDMSNKGLTSVMIRTVDTDVLNLALSLFQNLKLQKLWIDFGSGKQRCFLPIHEMVLDPLKVAGLRFFMAVTGCDQVSFFSHVSKATAWKVWKLFPEVNEIFSVLSNRPFEEDIEKAMPLLERFVILLYHRTSNCLNVNDCRRELFCKGRAIDNIPPTKDALFQHAKRAAYIGGHVWGSSLSPIMNLPPFENFGWNADTTPYWTDLPQASKALRELIRCNCTKGCTGNCKCKRSSLPCTELCKCKGGCQWNNIVGEK